MVFAWYRRWRRGRVLRTRSIDEELWQRALSEVPAVARLEPGERARLRELVLLFLAEKQIEGVRGCELTEVMRYVIAVQACLLILNLGIEAYDGWTSIYVYPDSFVDRREREFMNEEPMAGAAMQGGAVALSWEAVLYGSNRDRDGFNPVYHEFAHKLDMRDGAANGVPPLPGEITPAEWKDKFSRAFEEFRERADTGLTEIRDYAATSPAEFFAVLTEAFFEVPDALSHEMPEIYDLLRRYYRQDPER